MKCPFCKKHPTSVSILQPDGENVLELELCEFCAKNFNLFEGACPSVQMLAARAESGPGGTATAQAPRTPKRAAGGSAANADGADGADGADDEAGETAQAVEFPATLTEKLKNFQKTGRLAGPDDYAALESQLKMLFQKIQGGAKHTGKSPHATKSDHERANRRAELEEELAQAVKAENYEKAARLRDQIKQVNEAGDAEPTA